MTNPTLFDDVPGLVGHTHPDTSREAALLVMPRTGTQRRRVFDYLVTRGEDGATDDEMQRHLYMSGNTERPRRVELVDAGLVIDSGERRIVRGRSAIVWKVAS